MAKVARKSRRRKEKSISSAALHISNLHSIIPLLLLQTLPGMQFLGQAQADWDLEVLKRAHLSQHKWLLKPLQELQWNMV